MIALELPGRALREIRKKLGLKLKDVELQSRRLAENRQNPDYLFTAGRLSQIENSASLPSIYKLATLSAIYRTPYTELLQVYGIVAAGAAARDGDGNRESDGAGDAIGKKEPATPWV